MTTILIIEDEEVLLEQLLDMLTFEGYDVLSANNGIIGVQVARDRLPDLIISDIMMPELDGYGVLLQLRENPSTATIPFIFLTAMAKREDMRRGMKYGANDYLTKPFKGEELLEAIESRLEQQAMYSQHYANQIGELRSTLIYSLPHELRTPLNSIMGFAEILVMDDTNLEPARKHSMAQFILKGVKRLHRLVENYLFFAQIEIMASDAEKIRALRNKSTDDPKSVIIIIAEERAAFHRREDDLIINNDNEYGFTPIAQDNLVKILYELIDNAFKFSERGTKVQVNAALSETDFTLCVEDNGRGMSIEEIKRVGAYFQFNRALYEQQGLGLGLIIAKRLVELHGGEFAIQSESEKGTKICLNISR